MRRSYGDAEVYENARVHGDAKIYGGTKVHGDANVTKGLWRSYDITEKNPIDKARRP